MGVVLFYFVSFARPFKMEYIRTDKDFRPTVVNFLKFRFGFMSFSIVNGRVQVPGPVRKKVEKLLFSGLLQADLDENLSE